MSGSGAGSQGAFYVEESPDRTTFFVNSLQDGTPTYATGSIKTNIARSLILMQSGALNSAVTSSITYKFSCPESLEVRVQFQDIGASSNQGSVKVVAIGSRL